MADKESSQKSRERENKIQEMQILEQNLQNLLLQKQAFQMELSETRTAKREIEKSHEDPFKMVGNLLIKTDKKALSEELSGKEKLLDLRVKSIEKQEIIFSGKLETLQKEILKE